MKRVEGEGQLLHGQRRCQGQITHKSSRMSLRECEHRRTGCQKSVSMKDHDGEEEGGSLCLKPKG